MSALRRGKYPQVEPGAISLMHRAVAMCPSGLTVREALALVRRRHVRLLAVRDRGMFGLILPRDLIRAQALGLETRRAGDVAWRGIPAVTPGATEVTVRRHLLEGARAVLVREGRKLAGAIEPSAAALSRPALSLLPRLERQLPREMLGLLHQIGLAAESVGVRAYAVGGFVRDFLLGREAAELDIAVEGDGLALARRLASELGSRLVVHATFQTASLEGGGPVRIDVATAREERYREPGALPEVRPASLSQDLLRRDFSINAMALVLSPAGFGDLLDPLRGSADLARRRIRILHQLSFVEDPTRIFRAVRYQTRLGLTLDHNTRRALRLAADIGDYPALSGQRLTAELELVLTESAATQALLSLGRLGAFRILDQSYRFSPSAAKRVGDLGSLLRWLREHSIPLDVLALSLLALLAHLSREVAERCLKRLALAGEPLSRLTAALREAAVLARKLATQPQAPPSSRASLLRAHSLETLGGAWLAGAGRARREIEWFLAEGRATRPLLGGDDLLALGVAPGPRIGQLLDRLRDRRLDGVTATRDQELTLVRKWLLRAQASPAQPMGKASEGAWAAPSDNRPTALPAQRLGGGVGRGAKPPSEK
ncbi:MAG: CBS domain-containing protein [Candidatus Rokubacteria bacterium]|nr:CBS domain-containing protein [Candidatus Rokubacteria bacterium]